MTDISRLCMVCLSEKDENGFCPRCKKITQVVQEPPLLPLRTVLARRYCVARKVKRNGEGITYAAFDLTENKPVSVREFFPEGPAYRDADGLSVVPEAGNESVYTRCLAEFKALWGKLLKLRGLSALISVTRVFEENGTAYAVYDETEQITLRDYLLHTKEGFIPWERARFLLMPVLSTLGTLHTSGIIHKGINPSAFIFSKDRKLKLTDFCIDQERSLLGDIEAEVFDGYTPFEQYGPVGSTGPWSDIYAFCSVLYRALIGTTPIDAKTRAMNDRMMIPAKFAENLPPYVINALINGMQIKPENRTDNIEQLRSDLSASPRAVGASAPEYKPSAQPQKPAAPEHPAERAAGEQPVPPKQDGEEADPDTQKVIKRQKVLIGILCVILAALIFGIGFFTGSIVKIQGERSNTQQTTAVPGEQVTVPDFRKQPLKSVLADQRYKDSFSITADPNVPAGIVTGQSVPAGTSVPKGSAITLFVSSGPEETEIPDVSGKSFEEGRAELEQLGFVCEKQSRLDNSVGGEDNEGKIFETLPSAGQKLKAGEKIVIVVYVKPEELTEPPSPREETTGNSVEEFLLGLETTVPTLD